ncbi:MAG: nucleotide exchange factor GrpE, partial [Firmicutes bacterium]|nr:nucleotide exchange factor GrpE [Bacillota bacterium]
LMADFQNYKRRVEKEKSDIYAYANEKIVSELLNVIDNFERALQHECADERYVEGMQMIFKQFAGVLEKAGLEEITAEGEDFDPNFHNAVMTEDNPEFGSGKVTEVLQKGYLLNKKVIRPSMVKVNN